MHELRELQFVKIFKLKLKSAMHALDITLLGLWPKVGVNLLGLWPRMGVNLLGLWPRVEAPTVVS
jgi:hypothetical protein